ncbi:MAG: insulinase family protein [Muribaculaceae bacterium]|nr:insulinase family protein [Muribaculaceae bacterium]
MKRNLFKVLLSFAMILAFTAVNAAIPADDAILPLDGSIRYGKLSNGLTYYIKHNAEPKGRADFYIAQKVGSILEEENQRGLAHFLEHMAFNGTKHFPGKNLLEYLQNNGITFGGDINAYTGIDQTVYYISNVPTSNKNLVDSVTLALYDWGNEISLLDKEIESERGVINEEWRTRGDANMRMMEALFPKIFEGSKYANRLPIGTMDVVMNFKPKTLREYYETWYRPDQQGIIIIGDFDAVEMEQKVIKLFSESKMPKNPKERKYYPVMDNKEPIYALYTDPESAQTIVQVYFKHETTPVAEKATMKKYRSDINEILTQIMLMARFQEIAQTAQSPFLYAYGYDDNFSVSVTKDAYNLVAVAKENMSKEAFEAILLEARRAVQHGFTEGELERAKMQLMTSLQNQYLEKDKMSNRSWAKQCVDNFVEGSLLPGIEFDIQAASEMLPAITTNDINKALAGKITNENIIITISGNNKPGLVYPTKEEILASFNKVLSENTEAYVDSAITAPLLSSTPVDGAIVSEDYDKTLNVTTLKLSNGVTVYLKPTDFKNDEILMTAISYGGKWAYKGANAKELKLLEDVMSVSALGDYTRINLSKYMADKTAEVNFSLREVSDRIDGQSSKKDFETMLQLNYEYFTDLRKDDAAFEALKSQYVTILEGKKNNPRALFSDAIQSTLRSNNPLYAPLEVGDVKALDYDKVLEIARERLANAGDFSFTFIGNFDVNSIKPYITKYIASLPDNGRRDAIDYKVGVDKGKKENVFNMPMENPKSTIFAIISGNMEYSLENEVMMDIVGEVMDINYTNTIREEEGGTYGVSTGASLDRYTNQWSFSYYFDTNVDAKDRLNKRAMAEFRKVLKDGVDENIFRKVKETKISKYEMNQRKNTYWRSVLVNKGLGLDVYTGYEDIIKNITPAKLNAFMKKLDSKKNSILVNMNGVAK